MHLLGAGLAHHLHDLLAGRAAHDRIVDQHHALAFDHAAVGVVLQLDAHVADRIAGLDEGAADIVVADDAELEGNAGLLREADRRRRAGIRHRHDDVGLDWALERQLGADASCGRHRRCGLRPRNPAGRNRHIRRCRSATSAARTGTGSRCPWLVTTTISPGFRSRTKRAPMMSSAQVSEARIQAPSRSPSTSGRMPSGSRHADHLLRGQRHQREGAFDLPDRLDEARVEVALLAGGDQVQDRLGVGGRREDRALLLQRALHGHGVGDVAVVGDGEAAVGKLGEEGLDVAQAGAAGGGVARVADGAGALQPVDDRCLVKVSPIRPTWRSTWNWLPS